MNTLKATETAVSAMGWSETEQTMREELTRISHLAYNRGLVGGNGGNVSVRILGTDEVLVTATGISLGDITPQNIVKVNLHGELCDPASFYRPSKETGFHCLVFRQREDVGGIVHVHPPYATAFSCLNKPLPLVTISARTNLKEVPCIEVAPMGSAELREYVGDAIKAYPGIKAILMRDHGILAQGKDLVQAFNIADLVEYTAKIAYAYLTLRQE
jgi:L-ribulose-5-phosphate 4-epimerase